MRRRRNLADFGQPWIGAPNPLQPHYDYFTLPGNERYYEVGWGAVDLFVVDSGMNPTASPPIQFKAGGCGQHYKIETPWKVVATITSFSSSAKHGSNPEMQWPFAAWAYWPVLAGHDYTYERLTTAFDSCSLMVWADAASIVLANPRRTAWCDITRIMGRCS